jgi:hypothetical protein
MKPRYKTNISIIVIAAAMLALAGSAHAVTVLLTDDFDTANTDASTFNNTLADDQGGTLATTSYSLQGSAGWITQHSNTGRLLVATSGAWWEGNGSVSLNNNFATQANTADQALEISFNLHEVTGYGDATQWVQFNVGGSQHLDVGNGGVGVGILFRQNGEAGALSAGSGIGTPVTWAADDLITIRLSGTGGVGSAFDGGGSEATISIGAFNYGTFPLAQQTNAYLTFSGYNYGVGFGLGTFDNLNVTLIPEPSTALLGGLGMLALLRRRRA